MRFRSFRQKLLGWAAVIVLGGFIYEGRPLSAQELQSEEPSAIEVDEEVQPTEEPSAIEANEEVQPTEEQLDRDVAESRSIDDPEDISSAPAVPAPEPLRTEERTAAPQPPGELGVRVEDADGAIVRGVIVGAAGNKAGVRPGDRIVAIDGQAIHSADEVRQIISSRAAGDTCTIEVERRGETKTLSAVLEPRVGYYDNQPFVASGSSEFYTEPVRHRRGRSYRPRYYSYRPYYYGPRYRQYYPAPRYYGRYYGTPRFGYYGRGWGGGGLQLGRLNIWW